MAAPVEDVIRTAARLLEAKRFLEETDDVWRKAGDRTKNVDGQRLKRRDR